VGPNGEPCKETPNQKTPNTKETPSWEFLEKNSRFLLGPKNREFLLSFSRSEAEEAEEEEEEEEEEEKQQKKQKKKRSKRVEEWLEEQRRGRRSE
jgi:hypothetical protein